MSSDRNAKSGSSSGWLLTPDSTIAAVIINWNSAELVTAAVTAVAPQVTNIIIVDNASTDSSLSELRNRFAQNRTVHFVALDQNRGFAGGTNAGTQLALDLGVKMVLWLNSDAIMLPGSVAKMTGFLSPREEVAAVGPSVLNPDNKTIQHTTCALNYENPPHWASWNKSGTDGGPMPSEWLSGEAMLIRAQALSKVGLLNEDFFFWAEDVEWSLRARRAGFELWCVPEARCLHEIAGSSTSEIRDYFAARNLLLLLRFYSGRRRFGALILGSRELRWQVRKTVREGSFNSIPMIARGIRDGLSPTMRRRYP